MDFPSGEGRLGRREGRFLIPLGEEVGDRKLFTHKGGIKVGEGKRLLVGFPLEGRSLVL